MKWAWEPLDPEQDFGNWGTANGERFFCQWVDAWPPREDVLRGALRCHFDDYDDERSFADFDGFYDADV